MILSISQLAKSYGDTPILKNITFKVEARDKLAIIGVNGAGKTTLFRILSGQEEPTSGTLSMPKHIEIGYLSQNLELEQDKSCIENLTLVFSPLIEMEEKMHELEAQMGNLQGDALNQIMAQYDRLMHTYEENDGYSYKSKIRGVLAGLGFTQAQIEMPVANLSGGQKTRLSLGKLLLKEPDLLLLDEPTNHLDIDAITWLEGYLKSYRKAVIIISHDRYFIDTIASGIIEIENGKSTLYQGNYQQYADKKKELRQIELKHYLDQQKIIQKQEESIALLHSFNREKQVKRARSKEKQLEKMVKLERPEALPEEISLNFRVRLESGFEVLKVRDLSKSFDHLLFQHLNFDVKKQDRIAIIGPNGIGKTTFFKILLGEEKADSGHLLWGSHVEVAYYDQEHASLNPTKTIFDEIHDAYPLMTNTQVRQALAAFQFKQEDVFKEINVLSGGEKGRVVLCKLLLKQANLLILDEPTNHLDISSKEVLEDALNSFDGTILFISHDRYFINKIANKVLDFNQDHSQLIDGNYDTYLVRKHPGESTVMPKKETQVSRISEQEQRKMKNTLKNVERKISELEEKQAAFDEELASEEVINDYQKYNDLVSQKEALEEELNTLLEQWESLSEALS
ncbi:MAG TPA: ABC-F type ribosomal protection protein [Candidatus Fimiplasma intestinipullorum]|uniref:ABC-F type ribosomal protection protein n=1 Tax=Candidatus Fimiplasma intestinipullorum TaxID=2840825 RepID=A0A9D1HNU9_9FIRM|nr:ABC-F type ribosomal protection protein [Candidatus Fimiplasma intestinipullorum]